MDTRITSDNNDAGTCAIRWPQHGGPELEVS
jgi:hypothetical protein